MSLLSASCRHSQVLASCTHRSHLLQRGKAEWHHRWGETFGLPSRPETSEADWRPHWTPPPLPDLPVHGVRRNVMVEPTNSSLRWDAATNANVVPFQTFEVQSVGGSTRRSGRSFAPVPAMSITSSNDRRKDLLVERQLELQSQLEQVEHLLKNAGSTTQASFRSEDWRPSTGGSQRPPTGATGRPLTGGSIASSGRRRPAGSMPVVAEQVPESVPSSRGGVRPPSRGSIPLCQNIHEHVSPMISSAGVAYAVPGGVLSRSFNMTK